MTRSERSMLVTIEVVANKRRVDAAPSHYV
jgi:hypothetical protein